MAKFPPSRIEPALRVGALAGLVALGLIPRESQGESLTATSSPAATAPVEIPFERYRLDNGLEVILHPDRSAPLVAVNLWYHVGSGDETPGKSGFAHLFEHMMFQGAKHIGEDAHFERLREIGATGINGTTNSERTNYFETVPSHQLETALWLESDRMGYMLDLLSEKSFRNQVDVVRNERRQRYDDAAFGRTRFARAAAIYPDDHPHRYLTIGRHEDLEAASLEDVRAFFTRWYVPSNATLVLAGDFEPERARELVDKWFGSFPRIEAPTRGKRQVQLLDAAQEVEVEDPFVRAPRLEWVFTTDAGFGDGAPALRVLAEYLNADWGPLHKALVLDAQVARRVGVSFREARHTSEFTIRLDVHSDTDRASASKALETWLEAWGGPKKGDLERVRKQQRLDLARQAQGLMGRAEILQYSNHHFGDPAAWIEQLEAAASLDAGAVQKAGQILKGPRLELWTRGLERPDVDRKKEEKKG